MSHFLSKLFKELKVGRRQPCSKRITDLWAGEILETVRGSDILMFQPMIAGCRALQNRDAAAWVICSAALEPDLFQIYPKHPSHFLPLL